MSQIKHFKKYSSVLDDLRKKVKFKTVKNTQRFLPEVENIILSYHNPYKEHYTKYIIAHIKNIMNKDIMVSRKKFFLDGEIGFTKEVYFVNQISCNTVRICEKDFSNDFMYDTFTLTKQRFLKEYTYEGKLDDDSSWYFERSKEAIDNFRMFCLEREYAFLIGSY